MSSRQVKGQGQGFYEQVYELVRQVPVGYVVTYGQIAGAWKGFYPQRALLEDEGVVFGVDGLIDLESHGWRYGTIR